jgi:predicted nucleic acid-binding protein
VKIHPSKQVLNWLTLIDENRLFISVLTIGEIRKGVEKVSDQVKKQKIIHWLENDLLDRFYGRIINIDSAIADKWGYIGSLYNNPAIDALIAASAIVHNHKLVTRNVKDFKNISGLEIINPWEM